MAAIDRSKLQHCLDLEMKVYKGIATQNRTHYMKELRRHCLPAYP